MEQENPIADQIVQLPQDTQDDITMREFVQKRNALKSEMLRILTIECVARCAPIKSVADIKEEDIGQNNIDFTEDETYCMAKCENKVIKIAARVEQHLDDSFNPELVRKYLF